MKKPPDPGGSSCYSHSSCFSLVCYCSSAPISQKHGERDGASTDSSSSSDSDLEAQAAPDSEAESYPQPNPEAASDVDEIDVDFGAIVSVKVELKGGKTPSILLSNLLSFAASRIRVSPELPQQSYSNGPQVSISFSEYLVCLLSFELASVPLSASKLYRLNNFLSTCKAHDANVQGRNFTWKKFIYGQLIYEKLDRVILREDCLQLFPNYCVTNGPFTCSDHSYVYLETEPIHLPRKDTLSVSDINILGPNIRRCILS
ncbi:hypothetical protein Cgig2_023603 [Carnegiea gigantea]|uniref:Uncharacterized protein n=1 Tax=Carnegiea gigantea TaxID=171969 RepID=A0A9Q1QGL3_9CARY|nr:hypothetical protein Cgig2_023603 [Carnegiea gigantea]